MTPGTLNLNLYRGDTFEARVVLWATGVSGQTPIDLTGATVEAEWRDRSGGVVHAALVCVVTLPNIIDVSMPASAWDALTPAPTAGVWDLEVTFADGDVSTVLAGTVKVTPDVTNSVPVLRRVERSA